MTRSAALDGCPTAPCPTAPCQQARNLRQDELASFLVSGSTPHDGGLLRELGYLCAGPAAVYCSKQPLVRHLGVILLKNAPEIEELTPEYVMQAGKEFLEAFLEASPPEMVLQHYTPEQRLAGLDLETIRRYLEGLERKKGH